MGYEIYFTGTIFLKDVNLNCLDEELKDVIKQIRSIELQIVLMIGENPKNFTSEDEIKEGEILSSISFQLERLLNEYQELIIKREAIKLFIENKEKVKEHF